MVVSLKIPDDKDTVSAPLQLEEQYRQYLTIEIVATYQLASAIVFRDMLSRELSEHSDSRLRKTFSDDDIIDVFCLVPYGTSSINCRPRGNVAEAYI
jgi:hypothetical protein